MENYKSDEILKLEDQIALMEEKILKSFSRGSGDYNRLKNEQHILVNRLNKIKLSYTNNYPKEK